MRVHHRRPYRAASTLVVSAALLFGCSQLLGLKEDVPPGACKLDADCAPHQVCVSETCTPAGEVAGSGGSSRGGSDGAGAQEPGGAGESQGGTEIGSAGESNGGGHPGGGSAPAGGSASDGGGGNTPECQNPEDCPGTDNECAQRTCDDGVCGVDYEKAGSVVPSQTAGDCQELVCDGKGAVTSRADDQDVPDDGNPCRLDQCVDGVPSHEPEPTTKTCGANGQFKCDGHGVCGGCTKASDCGLDNLCASYACVANACKTTFVPAGEGNLANTPGDCKKNVCDGMGGQTTIADGSDLENDNNACTKDVCTSGVSSHPFESLGKPCGAFSACNNMGSCICSDPASAACPRLGAQCGTVTNGCNQQVSCPNTCSGVNTCNGAGNPNGCGCSPKPLVCGSGQCGGTVSDGCGHTKDCTADCQSICPDNCSTKICMGTGCYCADCNG